MSRNLAVFIYHPCHDLSVRVYVGGRNILVRTDKRTKSPDISASQAFKFAGGQLGGVHNNAALSTAIRQSDDRTF